jgi:hypothetical protein
MDEGEVYIGRNMFMGGWALKKSKWENPFKVDKMENSRQRVIAQFYDHLCSKPEQIKDLRTLRGKTLACWCHPLSCHGDVLAWMSNLPNQRTFHVWSEVAFILFLRLSKQFKNSAPTFHQLLIKTIQLMTSLYKPVDGAYLHFENHIYILQNATWCRVNYDQSHCSNHTLNHCLNCLRPLFEPTKFKACSRCRK